jgi:hypothetical protein
VDPAVVMRTDHDRFLTGIAQSRLARPERLKGAAFVPFHKPRVTGYVSGKDGSEAAAGRGHGWSEPSAVVVVENALTLAQLVHHGVRTTSRRVCSRNSWDVRARGRAFVEVRELKAPLSGRSPERSDSWGFRGCYKPATGGVPGHPGGDEDQNDRFL